MTYHKSGILLVFVLLLSSLSGCIANGEDGEQGEQGIPGIDGRDGSSLHMVNNSTELIPCSDDIDGQIFFVASESSFYVCSSADWEVIDLTGPPGERGLPGEDGNDGDDGQDGYDGLQGQEGVAGSSGHSAMAVTIEEQEGDNCVAGGVKLIVGVDENSDGALAEEEIDSVSYVCNGLDGSGNATPVIQSLLTVIESTPSIMACSAGGQIISQGYDDGSRGGISSNGILEQGEVSMSTVLCSKASVIIGLDLVHGASSSYPSHFGTMNILVGSTIYFSGHNLSDGAELWAFDLINETSWQISDINPGPNSSYPGYFMTLLHDDVIYFDADDGTHGRELHAYSTINHTSWLVADLEAGEMGSGPGEDMAISIGDAIFFTAIVTPQFTELWGYNPLNGTSWIVADIMPVSSSNPGWLMYHLYGDVLYFTARDLGNVHDVWAYNHSNSTTWKVAGIGPMPWVNPGQNMDFLIGDSLYFDADDGALGRELWIHNISSGLTWPASDISPNGSSDPGLHMSIQVEDTIYFDTNLNQIWAHNTINGSTYSVLTHNLSSVGENFTEFVQDGVIYFSADDGVHGLEVWSFDTLSGNHSMVSDIELGANSSYPGERITHLHGSIVFLDAYTEDYGREIWSIDLTSGESYLVADINTGYQDNSTIPRGSFAGVNMLIEHEGSIYFDASSQEYGREIWKLIIEHEISYE